MRKIREVLSIALVLCIGAFMGAAAIKPAWAKGLIGFKNMNEQTRVRRVFYPVGTWNAEPTNTSNLEGFNGVVTADAVPAGAGTVLITNTNPGTFTLAQRLNVELRDDAGDDTLTCTSAVIEGYDQFGQRKQETLTSITETAQVTRVVWERVTRLVATGCQAADTTPTATDALQIWAPNTTIGLGFAIRDEQDFIAACINDASATPDQFNCAQHSGAAGIVSALNLAKQCGPNGDERCFTFNVALAALFSGATVANDDQLAIVYRPRF